MAWAVLLVLAFRDIVVTGGAYPWILLGAVLLSGGALALALRGQARFSAWVIERERLAGELRASEARYSGILSIAADAIISIDESERIVHFNHGAESIFGYVATDIIGQPLSTLLPLRYRPTHSGLVQAFGRGSDTARRMGERRAIFGLRKNGEEFPAEASISKLELDGSRLFTVVLRDTTVRTRIEEDERFLSSAGSALAASLEYATVARAIADLPLPRLGNACLAYFIEGEAIVCVPSTMADRERARALDGLARRHVVGWDSPSPVVDVLRRGAPEFVERIDADWLEAHEEDPAAVELWSALGARDAYIVPLTVGARTIGALMLIAVDAKLAFDGDRRDLAEKFAKAASLTLENARLYRATQVANRARDNILGIVAHDLRNPIGAIAMCVSVLRQSAPDDPDRDELLMNIGQSTQWMNRLIQDLLDVSSIEQGHLSLERRREDVRLALDTTAQMFEIEARQLGVALVVDAIPGLPAIYADPGRIAQVLGNLMRNALTFSVAGGTITLGASAGDGSVVFRVSDSGPGISLEAQHRIFDRFWHDSRGTRARGTGLGLSIAKGIVEAHGGRIWLESTPGQGSTFYFSIPTADEAGVRRRAGAEESAGA